MIMGAAASGMLLASSAMAADQKIAVVSIQSVMKQIPQYAEALQSLEAQFKVRKDELIQTQKDIAYNQEKLKRDAAVMSKKDQEELFGQTQALYADYQAKGDQLNKDISTAKNTIDNRMLAVVRQEIDKIAVKEGYDFVMAQAAVLYTKPDAVITEQVVENVSKLK